MINRYLFSFAITLLSAL